MSAIVKRSLRPGLVFVRRRYNKVSMRRGVAVPCNSAVNQEWKPTAKDLDELCKYSSQKLAEMQESENLGSWV